MISKKEIIEYTKQHQNIIKDMQFIISTPSLVQRMDKQDTIDNCVVPQATMISMLLRELLLYANENERLKLEHKAMVN